MTRHLTLLLLAAAAASAGCQKEKEAKSPVDESPKPLPVKVVTADVSIASVSMVEDCPDAAAEEAKSAAKPIEAKKRAADPELQEAEKEASAVEGDSAYGYKPPCQQSFMQIAITGQGESSFKFSIAQVRVLDAAGAKLGTVKTRMPTIWKSEGYATWDEMVMPVNPVKASYKVAMPTWDDATKQVGGRNQYNPYMLEADVTIDGVSKTVRSPLVVPEPPEMVET